MKFLFTTTNPKASWHCFWSAAGKREATLDCTSSTNPDQEVEYRFRVSAQGEGTLLRQDRVLGRFRRTEIRGARAGQGSPAIFDRISDRKRSEPETAFSVRMEKNRLDGNF